MGIVRFLKRMIRPHPNLADELAFKRGTHLPVLQAILETFQPHGVMELGAGQNSTPYLYEHAPKLVTIETDANWVRQVVGICPPRENFTLIHHDIANVTSKTRMQAIPVPVKHECVHFYQEILERNSDLDLLFIDHVDGLRGLALAALHDRFDFVIYHDAEDPCYGYEMLGPVDCGRHLQFVFRTFVPHTGILIDKRFADRLPEFSDNLDRHARAYFHRRYRFDLKEISRPTSMLAHA
jgi:hypothetical protein